MLSVIDKFFNLQYVLNRPISANVYKVVIMSIRWNEFPRYELTISNIQLFHNEVMSQYF